MEAIYLCQSVCEHIGDMMTKSTENGEDCSEYQVADLRNKTIMFFTEKDSAQSLSAVFYQQLDRRW